MDSMVKQKKNKNARKKNMVGICKEAAKFAVKVKVHE